MVLRPIGKIMLDLEAVHGGLLGNDRLQQDAKGGNVPLAVAERIKQPAPRMLGIDLEGLVERDARRQHAKLVVEHDKRLGDRVDDRLRECLRVEVLKIHHEAEARSDLERKPFRDALRPQMQLIYLAKANVPPNLREEAPGLSALR